MSIKLFSVLSVLGLLVLVPANYLAHPPSQGLSDILADEIRFLRHITVENVPQQSPYLKVHLLFTWICSFLAFFYLVRFFQDHVKLKLHYQEHLLTKSQLGKTELRSIMVYGIPREMRDEVDLSAYFESLNIGKVETAVICRKFEGLREAVAKRAFYLRQLEDVYSRSCLPRSDRYFNFLAFKFFSRNVDSSEREPLLPMQDSFLQGDPYDPSVDEILKLVHSLPPCNRLQHRLGFLGLFGQQVDSAEYYAEKYRYWDTKVNQLRRMPESSQPTSVGFVTFESPESAIIASQINIASKPFVCMTRLAPEPRDLYWPNLSSKTADPHMKLLRTVVVYVCMFFMVFFNTLAVSAIASLIDLESLGRIIPGLKDVIDGLSPVTRQFIQGVIPTAVLAFWTSCLPSLLFCMSSFHRVGLTRIVLSQFQGLETLSWIEQSVLSKYFFYQVWNILFIVVSSTIFKSAAWPINTPKDVIEILGNSLPQESPTLINYAMLQAFSSFPAQLLLVGPLILTWLTRLAPWSRGTPRQVSDAYYPSTLTSINYGIAYAVPLLIYVIGLTYAPIAPLILPICVVFFVIGYFVFKYMLLYTHIPQYETGGMHAIMAVKRCLVGCVIMQLTMMGVLALKSVPAHERGLMRGDVGVMMEWKMSGWSGYVSMVIAVLPLLIMTMALFWWYVS